MLSAKKGFEDALPLFCYQCLPLYGSSYIGTPFALFQMHRNGEGEPMKQRSANVASKILQVVRAHPGCGIDDLLERLSDVQLSDVFVEVDRLSRSGELRITKANSGCLIMLHAVS